MQSLTIPVDLRKLGAIGIGTPVLLIVILAMMVMPLPAPVLDVLFTFNISLALVILLMVVYTKRPLDFSVFPTILLVATLLRLGLNIASTRVVLLHGHSGSDAAGKVIEAFGQFVVGGNYAVGLIVFGILIVINFVVITKGAGRISEVSARFTLDALPGKQMAIDADLNAGLITQDEARTRRQDVGQEADFYGAMDGASKFVRGDAIAGLLILFINIIGGLGIGILQHDLSAGVAARTYTLLTIGDGLVAQIPALVLSTGAAIIVTRVSTTHDVAQQVLSQLFNNPKALFVTAGIIGVMGLVPGMPNLVFLSLAVVIGGAAYFIAHKQAAASAPADSDAVEPPREARELGWEDVIPVDSIGLEAGYRLIPLVDRNQGGELMDRIKGVRKKLTQEIGFLIPSVHIRDNLELSPNAYRISLLGVPVGEAEVQPDRDMAIDSGNTYGKLEGVPGKDPAFGLETVWIERAQREHAQGLGYTVVDPSTVIATHLSHVLQQHAHELLGVEEVQKLLDNLSQVSPKLVEELVPKALSISVVVKVLQNLLAEQVSIRDIRTIAESLAEHAARSQDPVVLTTLVRARLGRAIVQDIYGSTDEVPVMTLNPDLEQILLTTVNMADAGGSAAGFEPGLADRILRALSEAAQRQLAKGDPAVLVVTPKLRSVLATFLRHTIPDLRVLAFNEIPEQKRVRILATVGA
ncbi:MAG: flagellar biosynthesis protein FlhA [Gammaproteobacteria bacterium]|nr:flagellar biosynthesis protein FlhA [Gammaproteobacteria bacterium]